MAPFIDITPAVAQGFVIFLAGLVLYISFIFDLDSLTRSKAERIAVAQFKSDYPEERYWNNRRFNDGELEIVAIRYGSTKPGQLKFYVVSQVGSAPLIVNDSKYQPKMRR